jgi:CMP-N-acetylneuraminate monooxygenase
MTVRVGPDSLLDELPRSVNVDGNEYIVSQNTEGDPVVFSSECPHQGGTVEVVDEEYLRCPRHNWEFDPRTGVANNVPNESLPVYDIIQRGREIYADIPHSNDKIQFDVLEESSFRPTVELLSHATLSIKYDGFRLVTDPWIDGPAFLGGWTQYPPPTCDADAVAADTDAVWITHEHPDHLHPGTLEHFSDETPIYVPELNYRRLSTRLHELGFESVHALPTEAPYRIADNVEAVCFESNSMWNDSILAINCGGFKILNFNDAGVNWEVNRAIPNADLIATGFSIGASGYPITWNHIDAAETREIIAGRNEQQLKKCEQLAEMFDAEYLLPFAKFFALVQPEHEPHRELLNKNRPKDVVERFEEGSTTVLDLLPGEVWDGPNNSIERRPNRERFFEQQFKQRYLEGAFESQQSVVSQEFDLTHEELSTYFETLGGSDLSSEIESFALTLSFSGDDRVLDALVVVSGGELEYRPTDEPVPVGVPDVEHHVTMTCPGELVQYVVRNDRSWDDIHIGYWCEFKRNPDEYNLGFWRLLHAPWEARKDAMRTAEGYDIETELTDMTVADLVEQEDVRDILERYGLHCAGCPQGIGEDVIEAARIHGLRSDRARDLVNELEASVSESVIADD